MPAGGAATDALEAEGAFLEGALAVVWAAAGVSPAAAKAIAHPISLIGTPGIAWNSGTRMRTFALRGSIGAAFQSLKRVFQHGMRRGVEGCGAAA